MKPTPGHYSAAKLLRLVLLLWLPTPLAAQVGASEQPACYSIQPEIPPGDSLPVPSEVFGPVRLLPAIDSGRVVSSEVFLFDDWSYWLVPSDSLLISLAFGASGLVIGLEPDGDALRGIGRWIDDTFDPEPEPEVRVVARSQPCEEERSNKR